MRLITIASLLFVVMALAIPAAADNPCQYIGIVWRSGNLSIKDGRPIVTNEFGTYILLHDEDADWTRLDVDTALPPNYVVPFAYSHDQWGSAQQTVLEFPGGPKLNIRELSEQAKDNPQLWIQKDSFEISNGTKTRTVELKDVREFGHAYRKPSDHRLVYLLTQDTSDEDASCGPDDGPGLVELNAETLETRLLFEGKRSMPNSGVWSIQITGNTAWMLTSTGVCRGDLVTGARSCWNYGKGIVKELRTVRPFFMGDRASGNHFISMRMTNPVKILGGRKPGFDEQFYIEIEPSDFYRKQGKRIYLDKSEIEPVLTKEIAPVH